MNACTKLSDNFFSVSTAKKPTRSSKISRLKIQLNFPATRQAKALEAQVSVSYKQKMTSPDMF